MPSPITTPITTVAQAKAAGAYDATNGLGSYARQTTPPVAPVAPTTSTGGSSNSDTSSRTTTSPRVDPSTIGSGPGSFNNFENSRALTPEETGSIADRYTNQLRDTMDLINAEYSKRTTGQEDTNAASIARTKALNANTGNIDSGTGASAVDATTKKGQAALDQIDAEKTAKLQTSVDQIDQLKQNAINLAETKKSGDMTAYQTAVDKHQTDAENTIKAYISNGGSLDNLKSQEPDSYNTLATAVGGEDMLKTLAIANAPQGTFLSNTPTIAGNQAIWFQRNKDGTVSQTTVKLPAGYQDPKDVTVVSVPGQGVFAFNKSTNQYTKLGAYPKAAGKANTKQDAIDNYSNTFVPGKTINGGTPVVDSNGYITPAAWKAAITDAPKYGITRAEFIKTFGDKIYSNNGKSIPNTYGLTPVEIKQIIGAQKTSSSSGGA